MADVKTKKTGASVSDFLSRVPNERRRRDARTVLKMMRRATGCPPAMWGPSIVGFGTHRYIYASGREGDWPVIAFSPRKHTLTLYLSSGFEGYAERMSRLGKFKTTKACLYLQSLQDVDLRVLQELIEESVRNTKRICP
jgi:hypothetical protein